MFEESVRYLLEIDEIQECACNVQNKRLDSDDTERGILRVHVSCSRKIYRSSKIYESSDGKQLTTFALCCHCFYEQIFLL